VSAAAELACVLEATAPKVGNVHPGASFADMRFGHFLESAAAIGPVFERVAELSIGELVLESVKATRAKVGINTNLGTVLLFAPMAKARLRAESWPDFRESVACALSSLNHDDSKAIYEAIRIAKPGGLGAASQHDVQSEPPVDLIGAMRHAAAIDAVARQYANGYADLFERLVPWFEADLGLSGDVFMATCAVQVRWLSEEADGLIVRKCGVAIASQVQSLALQVVQEVGVGERSRRLLELDIFLRADSHRRNPGTTADLMAAMLFAKLLYAGLDTNDHLTEK
jgi:triphosphoribosyl-dephospho-CoA synthase